MQYKIAFFAALLFAFTFAVPAPAQPTGYHHQAGTSRIWPIDPGRPGRKDAKKKDVPAAVKEKKRK
jgi:hypothetical protein